MSVGGITIGPVELVRAERLLLRNWEESDLAAFFELYSRDEVTRWLGTPPRRPVTSEAEALERLRRWREHERGFAAPLGLWAMVPDTVDGTPGQPVGTALLLPLHDAGGPAGLTEVGWHLHPRHQAPGVLIEPERKEWTWRSTRRVWTRIRSAGGSRRVTNG